MGFQSVQSRVKRVVATRGTCLLTVYRSQFIRRDGVTRPKKTKDTLATTLLQIVVGVSIDLRQRANLSVSLPRKK